MNYQSFIGLEVHIHLLTKSKVFCKCDSAFGAEPNTHVCPVCMGYPGVLPALNIEAMRMGCTVARALNCSIPERTWFERKQYFYPDMTKNYQISQFASPLGQNGYIILEGENNGQKINKKVRIKECHLEEDAGKMIHTGTVSLLDYNRAGVSLLEIVTEPDMETGEEAELFIRQLRRTVRYLGVCDGNMEEGSLRADANVSINTPGAGLGKKVECKNLNSSRFVRLALNYEIGRQAVRLDEGKTVVQETRLWNENRDQTEPMRQKENAQDYRYFPEPDLPVFTPDAAFLKTVDESLVELPQNRIKRMAQQYGLDGGQIDIIADEKEEADFFEESAKAIGLKDGAEAAYKTLANYFLGDIRGYLNKNGLDARHIRSLNLKPAGLAGIVRMQEEGRISSKTAKKVLEMLLADGGDPEAIVAKNNWEQIRDKGTIEKAVNDVLAAEAATLADLKKAKDEGNAKRASSLTAFLAGKAIAATGGRADPRLVQEILAGKV
ncbi:MAG: Asp-tRNA(Asn)/Glu-tRNA(Gln) amidotransferase subunit GatB [Spirochaetaceae bacterium]|nr:Asp-tRNA(Asn)/Glu-tRNA(Gln) amidotransferase subunit GatB [Spirochaetaceae bacterium]